MESSCRSSGGQRADLRRGLLGRVNLSLSVSQPTVMRSPIKMARLDYAGVLSLSDEGELAWEW